MSTSTVRVRRRGHLAPSVVFVDGIEGCGKTMLSPIVSALDRAELPTYAYEIQNLCSLVHLEKLDRDAAGAMISMLVDLQLYNSMQSRETNFRPSDLSSVFRASQPWRYFRRLFQPGGQQAAERIVPEDPILCLTTHRLLAYCEPIYEGLGDRCTFVEVVRHPLYLIVQNTLNFSRLFGTPRNFTIHYDSRGMSFPYFAHDWEDRYLSERAIDRAIYHIQNATSRSGAMRRWVQNRGSAVVTVPFEKFVLEPEPYMRVLEDALGTRVTRHTRKMMAKQNVPRATYAASIDLAVYRRCGWVPPKAGLSELEELETRRLWAASEASPAAMSVLDELCDEYEVAYMDGRLRQQPDRYI
jgi:hypothetical protein